MNGEDIFLIFLMLLGGGVVIFFCCMKNEHQRNIEVESSPPEPTAPEAVSSSRDIEEIVNDAFQVDNETQDLPPTYEEVFETRKL